MRTQRRWIVVLAVGALIAAGCGDGDGTTDTGPPSDSEVVTTPADTTPPTEAPAPDPTDATTTTTTMPPLDTDPADTDPADTDPPAPTTDATPGTGAAGDVACTPTTVDSGATEIPGERCDPAEPGTGPVPAAVVLNGCGGYESDDDITSALVRALAERGVIALRLDWLAAEPAPPDTYCQAGPVIAAVQPLLQAIVDGVGSLRADPAVDASRIGTASYSLGALGAMAAELGGAGLTTVDPLGLSAAALLSYPDQLPTITAAAAAGDVPPLFLMTGELDLVAPPADAQALADAATVGGVPNELVIVPGQDHPWRGDAAIAAADVLADFLAAALTS